MENKKRIKELVKKFEENGSLEHDEMVLIVQEMQRAQLEVQELKRKEKDVEEFYENLYKSKMDKVIARMERKAKRQEPKKEFVVEGYCPKCKHLVRTDVEKGIRFCTACGTPTEEDEFDE